ncbi:S1 family peptidase [Acidipropionibacterium timonense]|uniref:S1 family peptidase n=1 Tax=Acidipropionibacterium timonense TaxID=2161818 RepID=UPI0010316382|nr:serine protease [Acidipropionibacterium timonense]
MIHGGHPVSAPVEWMASIKVHYHHRDKSPFPCGASQISPDMVLTAAHCVNRDAGGEEPYRIQVRVGGLERGSGGQELEAEDWWVPDSISVSGDWALIRIPRHPLSHYPILPADRSHDSESSYSVMGWGYLDDADRKEPRLLHRVELPRIPGPGHDCDSSSAICAGDLAHGSVDACAGDSGGPLFTTNPDGRTCQVGIVSWAMQHCGTEDNPGYYTRVSTYRRTMLGVIDELGGTRPSATASPTPTAPMTTPSPTATPTSPSPTHPTHLTTTSPESTPSQPRALPHTGR